MDAAYFTYRLVSLFFILFSAGTIYFFIRPRETVLHTLNDTLFDKKVFQADIYFGRIRQIILTSTGKYDHHSVRNERSGTELFKPPCIGLRHINGKFHLIIKQFK